jgi:hypothetical protein
MILHKDSHRDHIPSALITWVLRRFWNHDAFFTETVEIPEGFTKITCGLHGPIMGDAPVPEEEVTYKAREGRPWSSRLVDRPSRSTRQLTVIGGPYEGHPCVMYTAFGGPLTPKEPQDPTLESDKREESEAFWSVHALSI